MTANPSKVLADRLRELRFSEEFFPSEDMAQLKAIVEDEHAALEAEFDDKFRARISKLITRKTIGKIIGGASTVADNGDGQ
jgi:hypothetical protein